MSEVHIAKLFKNGGSQAVRLPADFRFEGESVFLRRDDETGDVILSSRPGGSGWRKFFALLDTVVAPDDFMQERPMNVTPAAAGVFDDERDE
ncbi:MAG: AbrB/MazE/SpoVT family DNA-binding domain-containing protein [Azoarcus sp.]|jgi:antitoxin VapB|nr:AbrB/MazE/SpoVT family DNA-binding domain-containing protein [Azoarcus sp.]